MNIQIPIHYTATSPTSAIPTCPVFWAELCPLQIHRVLTFSTSERDLIWRSDRYRGYQIKIRPFGWALIQYNWCSYKKRKFWPCLTSVAQLGHIIPQSERLSVQLPVGAHAWVAGLSPVGAHARSNWEMFFLHINASPCLFLPPLPSL